MSQMIDLEKNNEAALNVATRIEEDLLGERHVPADAYWGIHTLRAIENFNISNTTISDVPEFVRGMVFTKKAAAMANKELGAIPSEVGNYIEQACDLILETGRCMDQFPSDVYQGGAGTSVNMNTNEVIANLALELMGKKKGEYDIINPNDHVNKSQSTNCAYPTGFRVAVYNSIINMLEALEYLKTAFDVKATEFASILKMGRTQLQDAVPMTVGQEFHAYSVLLKEEIKNLHYTAQLLLEVNLGATAIGTGLNAATGYQHLAVQRLAEITGLPVTPAEDLIEATSDCGAYVMVHGALKRTAVKLSKICNDLRLLSSGPRAGLNEINLPEMQAGSSIMPAKVNPVIPEVVNQVCFKVIGNDTTITFAAEAGQLQLNVMEPVIGQALFESISLLKNACVNLREKCIEGITVNQDVCESYVFNSIGIVTYLNPFIGHHEGDIVGKICAETGKSVREVVLERGLLTEEQLDDIFSIENLMHPQYKAQRYN
ncbi:MULTISPECIES: aspartate ammonia-lyase [unclassified Photobacterium]|uniref:aspartate ammonia-lyase n=1 Tax=unclassified Photobacterium TaxID=2628852 RepID=UPI000D15FCEA|nr:MULTISPECIES: aspartate ammonia-lyase [unclassified Photobacterium]PSV24338.1 aspartate ammonia-lyase [Photobacterium sp. GB-56]PSV29911.1 aspartate ammonia-lyase [Photobacterium sp. GB-72]PSV35327.1 aspartate ammonia-lyase [Photobacterium sp. GB-210]PSV41634.1 aspartate ammonia-lyase [Photobacterium sp. GB-36]PSV51223.1 aspartate ammonia-lyase [Photobacterium sp. GB-1]